MLFALGYIAGLVTSVLVVATLAYFRRVIEHKTEIIEKQIDIVGPRPRGYIVEPDDEADEIRRHVIELNRRQGRDTRLEELQ